MGISKRVRRVLWTVAGIVVLAPIIVIMVVVLQINRVVKTGIEVGGKTVLGVDTTLGSADVSLLGGRVELKDLNVANPEGFTSPSFVKAGIIRVDISPAELLKKEVYVQEITLAGPEFTFEYKKGGSNIGVLMDRLKGEKKPKEEKEKTEKGAPVKLKVDLVRITNAKVHVAMEGRTIEVSMPDIEVRNIADKNGNAIPVNELLSVVLGNVAAGIEDRVSGLVEKGQELLKEKVGKEAGAAKKELEKSMEGAGKKLKGLLSR